MRYQIVRQPSLGSPSHLKFYNINCNMWLVLILTALLQFAHPQAQNVCYVNCREGNCLPTNALACTDCDLGLVNINNRCIGGSRQSPPVTYLKPNSNNVITDSFSAPLECAVSNPLTSSTTNMEFQPTLGSTFTRAFDIPSDHSYLQVKFNAIVGRDNSAPSNPSLLLTLLASNGDTIYTNQYTLSQNAPVSCGQTFRAQGVFFINQKISSSRRRVILELRSPGNPDATIGSSHFELYFGNCSSQCDTCFGPTNQECLTCRGLLTTISNGNCSGCPDGFYLNGQICETCPYQCATCEVANNQVQCVTCNPNIAVSISDGLRCESTFYAEQLANQLSFSTARQRSSQTTGSAVTQCGAYSLVGGISVGVAGSQITDSLTNLPAHTRIYILATLFLVDQQLSDTNEFTVSLDGQVQTQRVLITPAANSQLTNECGSSNPEKIERLFFEFEHNTTNALLVLNIFKSFLGLRDIVILANNQTNVANCFQEFNGSCIACRNGLALINGTCDQCGDGYYLNNGSCFVCPVTCATCELQDGSPTCLTCDAPLVLNQGFCVDSTGALYNAQIVEGVNNSLQAPWNIYPRLQNNGIDSCANRTILGTSTIRFKFLSMNRNFAGLPGHNGVVILMHFYQIDDYVSDESVFFMVDSQKIVYNVSNIKMELCGNQSADAIVPLRLDIPDHTASTLTFEVHMERMGKFGIENLMLYLVGSGAGLNSFEIQSYPTYSDNTPPVKGLTVKLTYDQDFSNVNDPNSANIFRLLDSRRLLQSGAGGTVLNVLNSTVVADRQIRYLLDLNEDAVNKRIEVQPSGTSSVSFGGPGNTQLITQTPQTEEVPRYVEINENSVSDRSSMRNLFNLFRACAILGLFFGLASFFFGFSGAFDDFFILCQLVFIHVFIQLPYNPPSVRVPFEGLQIVQFLAWLPWQARESIESGILPDDLYQESPIAFEVYFADIVFFRTIYHTVLFLLVMAVFWAAMHLILESWEAKNPTNKYSHYFLYYYYGYDSRKLVFVDRVVRFIYFTVAWACVAQFNHLSNEPSSFSIGNSVLTVVFFILVVCYPVLMSFLLYRASGIMSHETWLKRYQEMRIDPERLFYFMVRYYKLLVIAIVVGFTTDASPVIPLIILIVLHLANGALLIFLKPLAMKQNQTMYVESTIFYERYPTIYFITTVLQEIFFIVLEIMFLVLYGQRDSAGSAAYMGIGYAICVVAILLLLNGALRLFWGFMKIAENCHLERETFEQSIARVEQQNKDQAEENPILEDYLKSQAALSRRDLSRLQSKKMSYMSKMKL